MQTPVLREFKLVLQICLQSLQKNLFPLEICCFTGQPEMQPFGRQLYTIVRFRISTEFYFVSKCFILKLFIH